MAAISNPVGWFEIPSPDLALNQQFFTAAFGYQFEALSMPPYDMAMFPADHQLPGATGALICGPDAKPSMDGITVYFGCDEVSAQLARIEAAGGVVLMPKTSIGEHGFIGMFSDKAGNKLGLHSIS
jgi:predicted enzyme related to lactoylglutathione lyase